MQAKASRELHRSFRAGGMRAKEKWTKSDEALYNWSMIRSVPLEKTPKGKTKKKPHGK